VALNEQIDEIGRLTKEAESSWEGKLKAQETLTAEKEKEVRSVVCHANIAQFVEDECPRLGNQTVKCQGRT
jgi:hypothetical protein